MPAQSWLLTDVDQQVYQSELQLDAQQIPGAPEGARIRKWTHHGGLADGVDQLRIHNGRFEFAVLPTRGMGLWRGWLGDLTVGWQSPVRGPVHPRFVPLTDASGLGWLDGFDEWVCRCGAESNGAPEFDQQGRLVYGLHGRIANLPARRVEVAVEDDRIQVRGVVEECRFHFHKLRLTTTLTTRFGQPGLEIRDELTNLSAGEVQVQMLYHCNFGPPWLETGAEVILPAHRVVPRNDWSAGGLGHWSTFSQPTANMAERVYFAQMFADPDEQTGALLRNAQGDLGVQLRWNVRQLPCFTLWKNETALQDGYVIGLEPGTNFPNPRTFEAQRQRVVRLAGGEQHTMEIGLTLLDDRADMQAAEQRLRSLQGDRRTELVGEPDPDWCAG